MNRSLAVVIGSPVAHSLSPAMHTAGLASIGVPWVYVPCEVAPGDAPRAIEAMRTLGIAAMSVTMPHKDDVARACDRLDAAAAALGTANTVAWDGDELVGYSTDGAGWVASLGEQGVDVGGASIAVIGAGGAARSIIQAAASRGAASLIVINRTAHKAHTAAALAGAAGTVGTVDDIASADIIVNTTSVGMGTSDSPIPAALLRANHVVSDIVYHPRQTRLLADAAACGARPIDGLGMLVHQAVEQELIWTGVRPDPSVLREAAERELIRRST